MHVSINPMVIYAQMITETFWLGAYNLTYLNSFEFKLW